MTPTSSLARVQALRSLSQNFLDPGLCGRVAHHALSPVALARRRLCVIEIGAGTGNLTSALLRQLEALPGGGSVSKKSAPAQSRIFAVEIDLRCRDHLEALAKRSGGAVEPVWGDALDLGRHEALLSGFGEDAAAVIAGNLPFSLATRLLEAFADQSARRAGVFAQSCPVAGLTFLVQRELAEKICAGPGHPMRSPLGIKTQLNFQPELLFTIKGASFTPKAKVDGT